MEHFANGKASLVGGYSFHWKKMSANALICAVQRGSQVMIPSGNFVIQENDKLHFTSDVKNPGDFLREAGLVKSPLKKVMIVGGGRIGFYLADMPVTKKYKVKLIEIDREKAQILALSLPNVTICCGNGTSHEFLLEEGIKNSVSSKHIVAERTLGYARAIDNSRGSNILTLYQLVNNRVETLEFAAKKPSEIYGRPLKELKIRKNCLIACIIRKNEVIIPNGDSAIKLGDNVVVVTTNKNYDDLMDAFE